MSIFPATDLIADVARAADPKRQQVAFRRLEAAASATSTSFASLSTERNPNPAAQNSPSWRAAATGLKASYQTASTRPVTVAAGSDPAAEAAKKFESLVLQTFFEALLPKDGESYGAGSAGNVWRSMMAEQLGDHFTTSNSIGIKKMLESTLNKPKEQGPTPLVKPTSSSIA
jgi:hypothetical protein